jgi:L-asparaginase/beta-aspartyl-peptidase (threonine type)
LKPIIIAHAGVGTPRTEDDGPLKAAELGFEFLLGEQGGNVTKVIDAVVESTAVLEDDPRFDAGLGSYLRLDGSIEMDAGVMDSHERIGGVIGIMDTKNPIYVARDIVPIPHNFLCGQGATDFARQMGYEAYDCTTQVSIDRLADVKERLLGKREVHYFAKDWKRYMDESEYPRIFLQALGSDTVGAVARDSEGNFAVAVSSGGISYQLPGRVGDSGMVGAGFYSSKKGAVCTTGIGEAIQQKVLAKAIYDIIDHGESVEDACEWGMSHFDADTPVGIIVITRDEYAIRSNEEMAHAVKEGL